MNDMSKVIIPKSDQLNAEDFLAGPQTYTIETVEIRAGAEQPVTIFLAGEDRAWKPCKSMCRVLVAAWGPDANAYKGRSVKLYRDPKVKWGGMEIGGIRISELSHIEREMLLQLTATKGKRAPHIVKPLVAEQRQQRREEPQQGKESAEEWADKRIARIEACMTTEALDEVKRKSAAGMDRLKTDKPDLHAEVERAFLMRQQLIAKQPHDASEDEGYGDDA